MSVEPDQRVSFHNEQINRMFLDTDLMRSASSPMAPADNPRTELPTTATAALDFAVEQLKAKQARLIRQHKFIQAFKLAQREIQFKIQEIEKDQTIEMQNLENVNKSWKQGRAELVDECLSYAKAYNQHGIQLMNSSESRERPIQLFHLIVAMLKAVRDHGQLIQADHLGARVDQLIGLTFNNISCCYKRDGQIAKAEANLKRALLFQQKQQLLPNKQSDPSAEVVASGGVPVTQDSLVKDESALTQLNMCAIYQQKGDYHAALRHAQDSINKIEPEIRLLIRTLDELQEQGENFDEIIRLEEVLNEKQSIAAIAYYNLGCQQEFLKQYHHSMQSYKRALIFEKIRVGIKADEPLTAQHFKLSPVLQQFQKSFRDMKDKAQKVSLLINQKTGRARRGSEARQCPQLNKIYLEQTTNNSSFKQISKLKGSIYKVSSKMSFKPVDSVPANVHQDLLNQHKAAEERAMPGRRRPMSAKNPLLHRKFAKIEQHSPKQNALMPGNQNMLPERNQQQLPATSKKGSQKSKKSNSKSPDRAGQNLDIQAAISIDEGENKAIGPHVDSGLASSYLNQPAMSQAKNLPRSKARKIRPASSYVKNQALQQQRATDKVYLSSFYQNKGSLDFQHLNEQSDFGRISNIDSISNLGIAVGVPNQKTLQERRQSQQNTRQIPARHDFAINTRALNRSQVKVDSSYGIAEALPRSKPDKGVNIKIQQNRSTQVLHMPPSSAAMKYKQLAESNADQRMIKLTNPGIRERPIYLQRPQEYVAQPSEKMSEQTKHTKGSQSQSAYSRVGFSEKLRQQYAARDEPLKRIKGDKRTAARPPGEQRRYKVYEDPTLHGRSHEGLRQVRGEDHVVQQLNATRNDGNLVDLVDRHYQHYRATSPSEELQQRKQKLIFTKFNMQVAKALAYQKEMEKQSYIKRDNARLQTELDHLGGRDSLDKLQETAQLGGIKLQRPQTAKPKKQSRDSGSGSLDHFVKPQSIEDQSMKRLESINSLTLKQGDEKKSRPLSAYTQVQQPFTSFKASRKDLKKDIMMVAQQVNDQINIIDFKGQPNVRFKTQYAERTRSHELTQHKQKLKRLQDDSYQLGNAVVGPKQLSKKRQDRPDNRPKYFRETSNSALKEIDEFVSGSDDSQTQILYSGHHTASLRDNSRDILQGSESIQVNNRATEAATLLDTTDPEPIPEVQKNLEDTHQLKGLKELGAENGQADDQRNEPIITSTDRVDDQLLFDLKAAQDQARAPSISQVARHKNSVPSNNRGHSSKHPRKGSQGALRPSGLQVGHQLRPSMKQNLRLRDKKYNARNMSSAKLSSTEGEIAPNLQQNNAHPKRPSLTHDQAAAMRISDNDSQQPPRAQEGRQPSKTDAVGLARDQERASKSQELSPSMSTSSKVVLRAGQKSVHSENKYVSQSKKISEKKALKQKKDGPEKPANSIKKPKQMTSQETTQLKKQKQVKQHNKPIVKFDDKNSQIEPMQSKPKDDARSNLGKISKQKLKSPQKQDQSKKEKASSEQNSNTQIAQKINKRQEEQPEEHQGYSIVQVQKSDKKSRQAQKQEFEKRYKSDQMLLPQSESVNRKGSRNTTSTQQNKTQGSKNSKGAPSVNKPRSDAEILSVINHDISRTRIADLLIVSNDGTSGYKDGESKFDETYFREFLEKQRVEKEKEFARRQEEYGEMFNLEFKKFIWFRRQQAGHQDDNKNIPLLRLSLKSQQMQDLKDHNTIVQAMVPSFQQNLARQVKIKQLMKELRENSELEDLDMNKVRQMVLTNQISRLQFPLDQTDDHDLDKERANAFLTYRDYGRLLIDTFPYKSMHLGLCQVMIIYRIKSHKLMIKVYESKDTFEASVNSLRVIQEINLEQLGVIKEQMYSIKDIENPDKEQHITHELYVKERTKMDDIFVKGVLKIIEVVRQLKFELTGDIYKDFYELGVPLSHLIEQAEPAQFDDLIQTRDELIQMINDIISLRVRHKFTQSEAFRQMTLQQELRKNRPSSELLESLATNTRRALVRKDLKLKEKYRSLNKNDGENFDKMYDFTKRFEIVQEKLQTRTKFVYLRIVIKVNEREDKLQLLGHDMRPVLSKRYQIVPQVYNIDSNFYRIFKQQNKFEYFLQHGFTVYQVFDDNSTQQDKLMIVFTSKIINNHNLARQIESWVNQKENKVHSDGFKLDSHVYNQESHDIVDFTKHIQSYKKSQNHRNSIQRVITYTPQTDSHNLTFSDQQDGLSDKERRDREKREKLKYNFSQKQAKKAHITSIYHDNWQQCQKYEEMNNKMSKAFEVRNQKDKDKSLYQEFVQVRHDPELRRFRIKTQYEFGIYKIQCWWRRYLFKKFMREREKQADILKEKMQLLAQNEMLSNNELNNEEQIIEDLIQNIGLDIKFNTIKKEEHMIVKFQRFFRLKMMMIKCRQRLACYHDKDRTILTRMIKEWFEDPLSPDPFNYLITVSMDDNLQYTNQQDQHPHQSNQESEYHPDAKVMINSNSSRLMPKSPMFGQSINSESKFSQIKDVALRFRFQLNNKIGQFRKQVDFTYTISPEAELSVYGDRPSQNFEYLFFKEEPQLFLRHLIEYRLKFITFTRPQRTQVSDIINEIKERQDFVKIDDEADVQNPANFLKFFRQTLQMDINDLNEIKFDKKQDKIPNGYFQIQPLSNKATDFPAHLKSYLRRNMNLRKFLK